jgi:hypothetical protein
MNSPVLMLRLLDDCSGELSITSLDMRYISLEQAEKIVHFVNSTIQEQMNSKEWYESPVWFLVTTLLLLIAAAVGFSIPFLAWGCFALGVIVGPISVIFTIRRHSGSNRRLRLWRSARSQLSLIKSKLHSHGITLDVALSPDDSANADAMVFVKAPQFAS